MKPRLLLVFLIIVLVPAGLVTWLGWRVGREEQHRIQREFHQIITESLANTRTSVDRVIEDREAEIFGLLEKIAYASDEEWRKLRREHPWIRQVFVLNSRGRLQFPNLAEPALLTEREREFLDRSRAVFETGGAFTEDTEKGIPAGQGWHTWYWNNGLHLIAWTRDLKSGLVVGAEIERMLLMAEILSALPAAGIDKNLPTNASVQLRDASDRVIYAWGDFEPAELQTPIAELKLSPPLAAWRLEYFSGDTLYSQTASNAPLMNFAWLLGAGVIGSMLLAVWFYREHCRDMREASQRVSFVNQVSHELKTPLTNIRLYAEMLDHKLEGAEDGVRRCVNVVTSESQRLSRLINNVLTFSRAGRDKLSLQPRSGCVDEVATSVIEHFRPSLESAGFEIEFDGAASEPCEFDPDALEQILTNLISNVEKYAANGKWLHVSTKLNGRSKILVTDRGPGVPTNKRDWIFRPFERLSDKLSDAAGTGIGLSIARTLARLHGGDLVAEDNPSGGQFLVTLTVQPSS